MFSTRQPMPPRLTSPILLGLVAILLAPATLSAQRGDLPGMTQNGPVILSAGPSVTVPDADYAIPPGHIFKSVFAIDKADTNAVNQQLTTIARFLNLHARNGVPKERLFAAAVVHGSGWWSLLSDSAYAARFDGKANPSRKLIEELLANNVQIVLCGQTAGFREVKKQELLPGVQLGLSAMTALNVFQSQGYQWNPW
jgi:intracellular sulfur oxidation DsrE/DsrF family protein